VDDGVDDEIDMTVPERSNGKPSDLTPEGTYDGWVTEASKGLSKTKNPKLVLMHEIFKNNENCGFIESTTPLHVDFRVENLVTCLGRPSDPKKLKPEAFIGRACQLVVFHDKFTTERGRDIWSAKVKTFLPRRFKDAGEDDGQPAAPTSAGAAQQGGGGGGPACPF